jgi:hypothetical protein
MHPGDGVYRNQAIRLSDLTVTGDTITGVTFEHCTLIGPAVVILTGGTSMVSSGFTGEVDAVLWPLGTRQSVIGAIAIVRCTIVNCQFQRVGLAYSPADEEMIRSGFGIDLP